MGVFSRNIGLIAGLISTFCYLSITGAMALVAWLPEESQEPLGWLYVAIAVGLITLLLTTVKRTAPADDDTVAAEPARELAVAS
jgi:MFS transporter, DHA1 family, multidrug resistance protein